jgi:hypothetical protein
VPSITPRGIERTDSLTEHTGTRSVIAIQVKTATGNAFRLSPSSELPARRWNQWYVFVALRRLARASSFLRRPNERGVGADLRGTSGVTPRHQARRDSASELVGPRSSDCTQKAYEEAWNLLEEPADQAPIHLPDWLYEEAERGIGWPDGHPGF